MSRYVLVEIRISVHIVLGPFIVHVGGFSVESDPLLLVVFRPARNGLVVIHLNFGCVDDQFMKVPDFEAVVDVVERNG